MTDPTTPRPTDAAELDVPITERGRTLARLIANARERGGDPRFEEVYAADIAAIEREAIAAIDPRVIAIGQAWVAAEEACGTAGVEGPYLGPRDQRDDFEAEAFAPNHAATRRVAPSPEAALLALAAALTDQERGS